MARALASLGHRLLWPLQALSVPPSTQTSVHAEISEKAEFYHSTMYVANDVDCYFCASILNSSDVGQRSRCFGGGDVQLDDMGRGGSLSRGLVIAVGGHHIDSALRAQRRSSATASAPFPSAIGVQPGPEQYLPTYTNMSTRILIRT